jgi:putative two-component system response regulator
MVEAANPDARLLIADDHLADLRLLVKTLENAGYRNLLTTMDPRQVVPLAVERRFDLIVLDLHMPELHGLEIIMELVRAAAVMPRCPILAITGDASPAARNHALSIGAKDFVLKPFDDHELLLRINNLLETHFLHQELRQQNEVLEQRVRDRTGALERAQFEILERLALAAEFRDDSTGHHTYRVGRTAGLIAEILGLDPAHARLIENAAPLHDIGKIAIPDHILLKPSSLTLDEFSVVKTHTQIGARILSGSHFPLLQEAEAIALTHHERWDGGGYMPDLKGSDIPLGGRIVAIADVFDALTHERPYKQAWPIERAVQEIARQRSHQFDPAIVDAFMSVLEGGALMADSHQHVRPQP